MTPEQKRTFNTMFGSLFLAVGMVGWGLAAYYAVTPATPRPAPVIGVKSDVPSCAVSLRKLGFDVKVKGPNRLQLSKRLEFAPGLDEKKELREATLAASLCPMKLEAFCFGSACDIPGMNLTLGPLIPNKSN